MLAVVLLGLGVASSAHAGTGVVGSFGGEGSGPGQIELGFGVGVYDATGDVYVADPRNSRINRFDADGNFERAWGWGVVDGSSEFQVCTDTCRKGVGGAGRGQFGLNQAPRSLAIDQSDGSVYAVDVPNFRIQKFDADGNFERAWGWGVVDGTNAFQVCTTTCRKGISGTGAGAFRTMFTVTLAVDPTTGNVLVADTTNMRIQEFTPEGAFVRMFGGDVQTGGTTGFEICSEAASCKVGVEGTGLGEFGSGEPRGGIAVSSTGVIYAAETNSRRIQRFTPAEGTLVPSIFYDGSGPVPTTIAVDRSDDHVTSLVSNLGVEPLMGWEWDPTGALVDTYYGIGAEYTGPALTWNAASGRGYVLGNQKFVYILGEMEQPTVSIAPVSDVTATTAVAHGTVESHGEPATHYRFEYSLDGATWDSTPTAVVPGDNASHQVSTEIAPPAGLEPGSTYQLRLVAEKPHNKPVISATIEFTTDSAAPKVETVGSPYRTATTAQLEARVNPHGEETTYRFEYGLTDAYGSSAPVEGEDSAGSGRRSVLASAELSGLQPGTTYHYRVVATNASGTSHGEDMTVTTRASDKRLSHGPLAGPPGSDRAYEQVNLSDTGGNPVMSGYGFSDDGNRAIYQVAGGTPISDNGTLLNQFFAERTASGWQTSKIWPPRSEAPNQVWAQPFATNDLSKIFAQNQSPHASQWLLGPGLAPQKIYELTDQELGFFYAASEDLSRLVLRINGPADPDNPVAFGSPQLYDITTGTARLISQLPDGSVPSCGVAADGNSFRLPNNFGRRSARWISADGSRVFFPSAGSTQPCRGDDGMKLYMRDLVAEETVEVAGPPVSGPSCEAAFIKSNDDSVFYWSQARLDPDDTVPAENDCGDPNTREGDVYRYQFDSGEIDCLTCVVEHADVRVTNSGFGAAMRIGVADDGSRVYFTSPRRLVKGEGAEGSTNVYRLDVASGDLKFVAPDGEVGDMASYNEGQAMTHDGSVILFRGEGEAMNEITSGDNGGQRQYYRYDDRDGSLVCVSCPADGSPGGVISNGAISGEQVGPNLTPMSANGDLVFVTSAPLNAADQNTARAGEDPSKGMDVYEWRDGRLLLVTDGTTVWPGGGANTGPSVAGITPSGRDVFFLAAAQLTPDAIDGFRRLYSARIGGGFEFPPPPPPCPLEVCQGEARGAPEAQTPGTTEFRGAGNVAPAVKPRRHGKKCKKQRGGKKRCAKKKCKKQRGSQKRCANQKKKNAKNRQNKTGRTH